MRRSQQGQAVVEYILLLVVVLGIVTTLGIAFRRWGLILQQRFACDITAACPGCPPDPALSNQEPRACAP